MAAITYAIIGATTPRAASRDALALSGALGLPIKIDTKLSTRRSDGLATGHFYTRPRPRCTTDLAWDRA